MQKDFVLIVPLDKLDFDNRAFDGTTVKMLLEQVCWTDILPKIYLIHDEKVGYEKVET